MKLILLLLLFLPTAAFADLTAAEKDFEQRLNVQMVETTRAKWHIEEVRAENAARLFRAESEYKIQLSRQDGMCEAGAIILPTATEKFCPKD